MPVLIFDSLGASGVERNLAGKEQHGALISVSVADIRDAEAVDYAARDAGAVFHLAAQVAVTTSLADPVADFEINARTLNLLEVLRRRVDPRRCCSRPPTRSMASCTAPACWSTRTRAGSRAILRCARAATRTRHWTSTAYGCSKGVADQYVLDYARVYGLPTVVFRMSCLYGPRQFGTEDQGWIAHFLIRVLEGQPITIYGDGRQVRDALFVEDAVDAWLTAWSSIDRLRGRAFNLGGGAGSTLSLLELLRHIRLLTPRPEVRFAEARPGDQLWYVSDTTALTEATGWQARIGLDDGGSARALAIRQRRAAPRAPAGDAGMRVALVNPNWSFDGSIYSGCREPHCRWNWVGVGSCSQARHTVLLVDGHLFGLDRRHSGRGRRVPARPRRGHDGADLPVLALCTAQTAGAARAGPNTRRNCTADRSGRTPWLHHAGDGLAQARRLRRRHG